MSKADASTICTQSVAKEGKPAKLLGLTQACYRDLPLWSNLSYFFVGTGDLRLMGLDLTPPDDRENSRESRERGSSIPCSSWFDSTRIQLGRV